MCNRRHLLATTPILLAMVAAACHRGRSEAVTGGPSPTGAKISAAPKTGLEVIGWMRRAHPSRELRSLSFLITSTERRAGRDVERQSRAVASLPGRLRVDVLPTSRRAGWVRNRQRLAVFDRGRRVSTSNRVDLGTLLAYDMFAQSIDTTIMWLDSANIRYALLRRDFYDGRPAWVVGAARGDLTSAQFWVDAERWHVVRVIQRDTQNRIADTHFTEHIELLGIPVPTRITTYVDGSRTQDSRVAHFAVNPPVPARAFDLARWRSVATGD